MKPTPSHIHPMVRLIYKVDWLCKASLVVINFAWSRQQQAVSCVFEVRLE